MLTQADLHDGELACICLSKVNRLVVVTNHLQLGRIALV